MSLSKQDAFIQAEAKIKQLGIEDYLEALRHGHHVATNEVEKQYYKGKIEGVMHVIHKVVRKEHE